MRERMPIALLLLAVTASLAAAAVPGVVNYQGRLTDNTPQQNPLDATVAMEFSIWDSASGGSALWTETQSVQVVRGLFNVLLGSTTPMPATLFTSGDVRYLEIHVSGETLTPRQRIATAPFANTAGRADDAQALGGVNASAYQQRIGTPCPDGYAINAVAADGTATCIQSPPGPAGPPGPPGPPGPGVETGSISGAFITCAGPQSRFEVAIPGRSDLHTTTDGHFLFSNLPAGTYQVEYYWNGYKQVPVNVTSGQTTDIGTKNIQDTLSDYNNCGACGVVCPGYPNASPSCISGTCGMGACFGGSNGMYQNCNNLTADGCETNVTNSLANCGSCGHDCTTIHLTSCASSVCGGPCTAGYQDCNANAADGCELDVMSDPTHCGACSAVCSTNHVTRACAQGSCQAGICDSGYGDCNDDKFIDGCEVNLGTSNANCGTCGHSCAGGQTCVSGSCV